MSYQSAVPARGPEVVLRLVPTVISGMVLGAALLTAYFQIPAHDPGLRIIALGGGLGALTVAVLTIRFRFRIRSGRLTATILWRRPQSVDLTRLTSAEAMAEQDASLVATALGQQRWLELRDETGSVISRRCSTGSTCPSMPGSGKAEAFRAGSVQARPCMTRVTRCPTSLQARRVL